VLGFALKFVELKATFGVLFDVLSRFAEKAGSWPFEGAPKGPRFGKLKGCGVVVLLEAGEPKVNAGDRALGAEAWAVEGVAKVLVAKGFEEGFELDAVLDGSGVSPNIGDPKGVVEKMEGWIAEGAPKGFMGGVFDEGFGKEALLEMPFVCDVAAKGFDGVPKTLGFWAAS